MMDGAEFSQLILKSERRLRLLVFAMVPGCRDVDDIIQESCAAMWKKIENYDSTRPFEIWALAFVRHQTLAYLKKTKQDRLYLPGESLELIYEDLASAKNSGTNSEKLRALEDCLAVLTEHERNLLARRYVEGESVLALSQYDWVAQSQAALYKFFERLQVRLINCIDGRMNR